MAMRGSLRSTAGGTAVAVAMAVAAAMLAAPATARAQAEQPVGDTGGALPGFVRVGAAVPLDTGLVVSALAGYGHRGAVVADDDNHHRTAVDLATSFRPLPWLALAARFSGRYDRHTGTGAGQDSGWVGDPRLAARAVTPLGGGVWLAAHAGLWMPGRDAPSLDPSAATADLVGLVSWLAPGGGLALGAQAGFRYDRSAESVDQPGELSPSDRMALGVSESNAALLGLGGSVRTGATEWVAEWSLDALVGDDAPGSGHWPMRLGAGVRRPLTGSLAAQILVEYSLAGSPGLDSMDVLYPVEPRFQALAGLTFQPRRAPERFGARLAAAPHPRAEPAPPPEPGRLAIAVASETGAALAGAEIVMQPAAGAAARATRTGPDGTAELADVSRGRVEIQVSHTGHRPGSATAEVQAGRTARVRVTLELALPPGQLRGLVRSFRGRPLAARLTVQPIGIEARCDPHGEFEVDLPPGSYRVSIEADGYHAQERQVEIEQDGVTILNVDLPR